MKAKDLKRDDGIERNAAWQALTPKEQLEALNRRLGPGIGAKRQREKLEPLVLVKAA